MADVFDQFEKKPHLVKNDVLEGDDGDDYGDTRAHRAYKSVDRPRVRLKIRPVSFAWERLPNRLLLRLMENKNNGTDIVLVYSFLGVTIKGRNLQPVAEAIENERCLFTQEFDPARHDKVTDKSAPYIEKITIHAPPPLPGMESPVASGED